MFRGRFEHNLDAKGRTSIPSKFRDVLQGKYQDERLVLTHFDGCIWAYPLKEWLRIENRISALPQFKKEVKNVQRLFVSGAVECEIDKQGRILILPTLREYGRLQRSVVFVGMSRRIEVWDKAAWEKELQKVQGSEQLQSSIEEVLAQFDI